MNFNEISVHDKPERSPGFLLWHISTTWRGSIEKLLIPLGLTHPQFVVLAAIGWLTRTGDRVSQATIGKLAGLDPNTLSQIIRGLEQKALISRESSSDRRAKYPVLSSQGSALLKAALPAVEAQDAHFFHSLTKEEMESLLHIFHKLTLKE